MIKKELIELANQNFKRGFDVNTVKDMLRNQGYAKQDVEDSIKYAQDINEGGGGLVLTQKISRKSIWLYASLPVILVAGIFIFFVLTAPNVQISEGKIIAGANINIPEGGNISFSLYNKAHTIKINSVTEDSVSLIIQSEPIEINLTIGEEKEVDVDGDRESDLYIKLVNITDRIPEIYMKKIEKRCIENWSCGEWSECDSEGKEKRVCSDLNSCGTENKSPERERLCAGNGNLTENFNSTNTNISNFTREFNESGNFNTTHNDSNISHRTTGNNNLNLTNVTGIANETEGNKTNNSRYNNSNLYDIPLSGTLN